MIKIPLQGRFIGYFCIRRFDGVDEVHVRCTLKLKVKVWICFDKIRIVVQNRQAKLSHWPIYSSVNINKKEFVGGY
jgi:hypothetical protein